jgi:hypothetical protein
MGMAGRVLNIHRVRLFLQDSHQFEPAAITAEMRWRAFRFIALQAC